MPLMPQAPRVVPPWQTPFMSQQPEGQLEALQRLALPPPTPPAPALPPPVPPPPGSPPPAPASTKKLPPPCDPASKADVWQVPALQTCPVRQSRLLMHRTGFVPPQALNVKTVTTQAATTNRRVLMEGDVLLQAHRAINTC